MTVVALDEHTAWLQWRQQGIGASDVAAAATGLYGGRVGVVASKLGIGQDTIDPALAERGERWEQPIADMVLAGYGYYVFGEQDRAEHPEHPEYRCTLDGLLHPNPTATLDEIDTLLEDKTCSVFTKPKWTYYRFQTQWQMWVTGMGRALIAVAMINDNQPDPDRQLEGVRFEWVDRDDFVIERLRLEADEMLACVAEGRLPEPSDGSTLEIIRQANATTNPEANETVGPALDGIADLIASYEERKAAHKAEEDELKLVESQIRTAMGEATEGFTTDRQWRVRVGEPSRRFTRDSEADALDEFPDYGRTVLDRERFKQERPDDYERLRKQTTSRTMTIKEFNK